MQDDQKTELGTYMVCNDQILTEWSDNGQNVMLMAVVTRNANKGSEQQITVNPEHAVTSYMHDK